MIAMKRNPSFIPLATDPTAVFCMESLSTWLEDWDRWMLPSFIKCGIAVRHSYISVTLV